MTDETVIGDIEALKAAVAALATPDLSAFATKADLNALAVNVTTLAALVGEFPAPVAPADTVPAA